MAISIDERLEILSRLQSRLLKIQSVHESSWIVDFAQKKGNNFQEVLGLCEEIVSRRERDEPLAYIFGSWAFRNHEFFVGPGVLIPRPETEELVEAALMSLENSMHTSTKALEKNLTVVDLGAGSGCVGLSLIADLLRDVQTETSRAQEISKNFHLVLVEKSSEAISYIQKNVEALAKKTLDTDVQVFQGSWDDWIPLKCDLMLSNPPYLTEEEFLGLENSVKAYEPHTALVPDDIKSETRAHGPYKKILKLAAENLNSGGWIWFELGQTQPEWILEFAKTFGVFNDLRVLKDMSKKNRFFCARKS